MKCSVKLAERIAGEKNANVDTLWRIADALGLRLSDFFIMVEKHIGQ